MFGSAKIERSAIRSPNVADGVLLIVKPPPALPTRALGAAFVGPLTTRTTRRALRLATVPHEFRQGSRTRAGHSNRTEPISEPTFLPIAQTLPALARCAAVSSAHPQGTQSNSLPERWKGRDHRTLSQRTHGDVCRTCAAVSVAPPPPPHAVLPLGQHEIRSRRYDGCPNVPQPQRAITPAQHR